jgi:hypothetical protein
MPTFVDLTGHRYGRWTVIKESGRKFGGSTWLCRCECGTEKVMRSNALRTGSSTSCGCYNLEVRRRVCIERNTTHGLSKSKVYATWINIRERCENPNNAGYAKYGAKGIRICERWQSFENFLSDVGQPPSAQHSIDRIDYRGNYEPSNCRWATMLEQQNNRSSNHLITAFGKTQTLQQWSRETGFAHKTLLRRLGNGWDVETALTVKPVKGRNKLQLPTAAE